MCVDIKTLYSTLGTTWIPRQVRWTYVVSRYAYVIALDNPKHFWELLFLQSTIFVSSMRPIRPSMFNYVKRLHLIR